MSQRSPDTKPFTVNGFFTLKTLDKEQVKEIAGAFEAWLHAQELDILRWSLDYNNPKEY